MTGNLFACANKLEMLRRVCPSEHCFAERSDSNEREGVEQFLLKRQPSEFFTTPPPKIDGPKEVEKSFAEKSTYTRPRPSSEFFRQFFQFYFHIIYC